jgi:indole-3-glycerol phosphate synthase
VPDFLELMARGSERRAREAKAQVSAPELRRRIADLPPAPALRLDASGFDLLAEVKRSSPSEGRIASTTEDGTRAASERARLYADAGAAAVSVLTEGDAFGGSLDDLAAVARALAGTGHPEDEAAPAVPAMRKDFLTDPYQLLEARAAGGGGALLVLRILDEARLDEMLAAAADLGLFLLLEAFDGDGLARAAGAAATASRLGTVALVGLNARDLATLEVDRARLVGLCDRFPAGVPRVAESGIATPEDAAEAAALGCDLALVGGALMRARDPAGLVRAMLRAGRDARGSARALGMAQGKRPVRDGPADEGDGA